VAPDEQAVRRRDVLALWRAVLGRDRVAPATTPREG